MLTKLRYLLVAVLAAGWLCALLAAQPAGPIGGGLVEAATGEAAPDGTKPACDLPKELRKKNIGSPPPNGPGCCVFRSLDHASRWQDVPALHAFPEWMVQNGIPGGGYPQKVDALIPKIAAARKMPVPDYVQVQSNDLEILKLALKTGRMASVTYGFSPSGRYGGQRISHMVNVVHADDKWFAVLDNNYIETLEWLTPQEFLRAYRDTSGTGWAVILLDPPPPPLPKNKKVVP